MKANQTPRAFADEEAVSPVVATLLLVLVAAGAAIGFGVFMGNFQDNAQKNVGTDVGGDALTIGGSTTVHPATVVATNLFAANHPGVKFELSQGGSTLGLKGVGTCALDVGARSKALTQTDRDTYPDCDGKAGKDFGRELVESLIGYDLVVPIVSPSACFQNMALLRTEVNFIYAQNGGFATPPAAPTRGTTPVALNGAGGSVTWAELEAYLENAPARVTNAGDCSTVTSDIKVYDRADKGGTSEVFCETYILTSGVCDSEKQITKTTLPSINEREGNAAVESAVKADVLALGFSSVGTSQKAGLEIVGFDQTDEAFAVDLSGDDKADCPTVSGTTQDDYHALARAACHDGYRALYYVTIGQPTGLAAEFIEFVKTPQNNVGIMDAIGYVPLY